VTETLRGERANHPAIGTRKLALFRKSADGPGTKLALFRRIQRVRGPHDGAPVSETAKLALFRKIPGAIAPGHQ